MTTPPAREREQPPAGAGKWRMMTDKVIDYLVSQGRDPLEAVFLPLPADLIAKFPEQYPADELERIEVRLEQVRDRIDDELRDYLARMPSVLRRRLNELIQKSIERGQRLSP